MAKSIRTFVVFFFFEVCRRQNTSSYLCHGESEALRAPHQQSRLPLDLLRFTGHSLHIQEQEIIQNGHLIAAVFNI